VGPIAPGDRRGASRCLGPVKEPRGVARLLLAIELIDRSKVPLPEEVAHRDRPRRNAIEAMTIAVPVFRGGGKAIRAVMSYPADSRLASFKLHREFLPSKLVELYALQHTHSACRPPQARAAGTS
jgi:hypothetical protein